LTLVEAGRRSEGAYCEDAAEKLEQGSNTAEIRNCVDQADDVIVKTLSGLSRRKCS